MSWRGIHVYGRADCFGAIPHNRQAEAKTFNWLLDSFTSSTAGVVEAIAVSSDGLLMAMSAIKDRPNAERLAAVVSGLTSLSGGAASQIGGALAPLSGMRGAARRWARRVCDGEVGPQPTTSPSPSKKAPVIFPATSLVKPIVPSLR